MNKDEKFEAELVKQLAVQLAEHIKTVPGLDPIAVAGKINDGEDLGDMVITLHLFVNTTDVDKQKYLDTYPADPTDEERSTVDVTDIMKNITKH